MLGRLKCKLGRHKLSVIARCGYSTDHVGCTRCGRQWGMNHDVRAFLPWSEVGYFHRGKGYREAEALAAWRSSHPTEGS